MRWNRVTVFSLAAGAIWICGMLQAATPAQDNPQDETAKPSKARKSKKLASDATSQATMPTETGGTASKAKKAKSSSLDSTSAPSADRAITGEKPSAPAPMKNASSAEIQAARTAGQVWVNTSTGVYHKNGKWYGATKEGKFMTEQDAIKAGYRAAKNEK
jgi:cytoskeletal protein RodZ